jgi:hypothetical protein
VGNGGNLLLVFAAFHNSVFSTALWLGLFGEWPALAVKARDHMRAIAQRHPSVEVFMNRDRTTGQRSTKPGFLDLPHSVADGDRVVLGHNTFRLYREYPVQIWPAGVPKALAFCSGATANLPLKTSM